MQVINARNYNFCMFQFLTVSTKFILRKQKVSLHVTGKKRKKSKKVVLSIFLRERSFPQPNLQETKLYIPTSLPKERLLMSTCVVFNDTTALFATAKILLNKRFI